MAGRLPFRTITSRNYPSPAVSHLGQWVDCVIGIPEGQHDLLDPITRLRRRADGGGRGGYGARGANVIVKANSDEAANLQLVATATVVKTLSENQEVAVGRYQAGVEPLSSVAP